MAGLVVTQQLMRQVDEAAESCRRLQKFARELHEPNYLSVAQSCQARLSVLRGDLNSAVEWGQSVDESPGAARAVHVAGSALYHSSEGTNRGRIRGELVVCYHAAPVYPGSVRGVPIHLTDH
jgi:hypothetical protein